MSTRHYGEEGTHTMYVYQDMIYILKYQHYVCVVNTDNQFWKKVQWIINRNFILLGN